LHHHRAVVLYIDQIPARRGRVSERLEDGAVVERAARAGWLRRDRVGNEQQGTPVGVAPPLDAKHPIDGRHPLTPFSPGQHIETPPQDLVGGSSGLQDVVAVARRVWPAEDPGRVEATRRAGEHRDQRRFLHGHRAHEHGVRGGDAGAQLVVGRPLDVEIEELERPLWRHERREREEPQRRERGLRAEHRHDVPVTPERALRKLGVEQ